LKGYRLKVFERFPRTGIPDAFESLSEYEDFCKLLVKTGCIDNPKKIWWDIRLHPFFDTLEVRVCDAQSRVDDTLAIAALVQAVIAKLYKLLKYNTTFRVYRRRLLDENRWRASRYGINGKMIDFGKSEEVPTRELIAELLEFIDDVVDELGSRNEINYVQEILKNGTGADRQVEVYNRTKDLKAVVDYIISETHHGLEL
jgi:carboxylate-amine ligase